eukprot:gene415-130_t
MSRVGDKVATALYAAAKDTEEQLDNELERLDKLKEDDIEEIRRKRLEEMRGEHGKRKKALAEGCGAYDELKDEKEFFAECRKHDRTVCVFFREGQYNSDVMKKHFDTLARKHWMTRFVCINAEKAPYLAEKLHIWMLPSIVLIKEGKTDYTIRGFDEVGGMDFATERLEQLLSFREAIPPEEQKRRRLKFTKV